MLVRPDGSPLTREIKRREMKSGQIKKTPYGDVIFKLVVDLPKDLPEDDYKRIMYEYGNVIAEAFRKR